ncbi:redoxin domain-containing protein [Altererythrobacter indicus]|uniref:thioredoxin-dependent peroxiredoxin n=1 Tax=Altericroceibacterium indicum TaxID=374177 RepID=A0A845A8H7_9SPHN|nr:peroxiredoxin [Altericroceibacterium indicum]MXP25321.1 redoxin domain-containing protein [Altericroceibacterium indicum]
MKTASLALFGGIALSLLATPALAALNEGAKAPEFNTAGALAGKPFSFDLQKALKKGPVVLYFFPKAFTQGCTLESNAFAQAMGDFKKAGAQVIGLSADDLPTLKRFSTEECRDAFPVAQATPSIIKSYDVSMVMKGSATGLTDRTSYVIGQDGKIVMVHSDLDWRHHVSMTLKAVQALHH